MTEKEYKREYYQKNKERLSALARIYRQKNARNLSEYGRHYQIEHRDAIRARVQERLSDPLVREKYNKELVKKGYRMALKYPDRFKARSKTRDAVKLGKITKQPCYCGEVKVQGHHFDYKQPLRVTWLCSMHHSQLHTALKYLTNYYLGL